MGNTGRQVGYRHTNRQQGNETSVTQAYRRQAQAGLHLPQPGRRQSRQQDRQPPTQAENSSMRRRARVGQNSHRQNSINGGKRDREEGSREGYIGNGIYIKYIAHTIRMKNRPNTKNRYNKTEQTHRSCLKAEVVSICKYIERQAPQ
jgi:hypothetical protein